MEKIILLKSDMQIKIFEKPVLYYYRLDGVLFVSNVDGNHKLVIQCSNKEWKIKKIKKPTIVWCRGILKTPVSESLFLGIDYPKML